MAILKFSKISAKLHNLLYWMYNLLYWMYNLLYLDVQLAILDASRPHTEVGGMAPGQTMTSTAMSTASSITNACLLMFGLTCDGYGYQ